MSCIVVTSKDESHSTMAELHHYPVDGMKKYALSRISHQDLT